MGGVRSNALDLTLLVNAQNNGLVGRVAIQTNHVSELGHGIMAEFERLDPVWLQLGLLPNAMNGCVTHPVCLRHRAHRPMGRVLWFRLHGGVHNGSYLLLTDLLGPTGPRPIFQDSGQPLGVVSLPPEQHRRKRGRKLAGQLLVGHSFRRPEHDLGAQDDTLRRAAMSAHLE